MIPELYIGSGAKKRAEARAKEIVGQLGHPDLYVISPHGLYIRIDQVREALGWARYGPIQAEKKVVLIGPAERFSHEAASALLKSLEESPAYLVFILFAAALDQLLPTIRSRCRVIAALSPRDSLRASLLGAGYAQAEADFLLWLSDDPVDLGPFFAERRQPLAEWAAATAEARKLSPAELGARLAAYASDPIRRRATAWALLRSLPGLLADELLSLADDLAKGGRESCLGFLFELCCFLREELVWPGLPDEAVLAWAHKASLARAEVEANANLRLLMEVIFLWPKKR